MKLLCKIISITLALVLSNVTATLANTGIPELSIKKSGEKTLHFESKGLVEKDFTIRIQDENGLALFSEYAINPETFIRDYNLSDLPEGSYLLLVEDDSSKKILPIFITADGLKFDVAQLRVLQ